MRQKLPRKEQGSWNVETNRENILDIIREEESGRIPELLDVRHERMKASPFAFYRACAGVMADDLSGYPVTGITVQTCGDSHIGNFGMFFSPERNLVFDINDFDETLPGPWEWDVKRLLASIEICGRQRGFSKDERMKILMNAALIYRRTMLKFSEMGNLDVWYAHMDMESLYQMNKRSIGEKAAEEVHTAVKKALAKDSDKAVRKLTEKVDGRVRIVSRPPLIVPLREMKPVDEEDAFRWMKAGRREYRLSLPRERRSLLEQYEIVDIARKVVGVGSVGTRDWVIVMEGREGGDYLVLQIKEAGASVLEKYVGKSAFSEHGRRVVEGQRAIQTYGDILLGWSRMVDEDGHGYDCYVRQLWDGKGSFDLDDISKEGLAGISVLSAWVLAHAHAKTGNRHEIAGYLGEERNFDEAMVQFAMRYADQNEVDYDLFCRSLK